MCLSNIPILDGLQSHLIYEMECEEGLLVLHTSIVGCATCLHREFYFKDVMCLCTSFRDSEAKEKWTVTAEDVAELTGEGSKLQKRCQSRVAKGQS